MRRRSLALPGLSVPELSLGTMNFGSDMCGRPVAEEEARAIVDVALASGCDLFDTADVYGRGAAEEMLGRLLMGRRERALIATKVLGPMGDGDTGGLSAARVGARLDDSLRRLRTDRIDLYMPHAPDPRVPLDDTLEALGRAVWAGKIRAWGLSNFPPAAVRAAWRAGVPGGPAFVQAEFSLVARGGEEDWSRLWKETGIPVLAWSPLAGGLLTGKYLRPDAQGRLRGSRPFPPYEPSRFEPLARMLETKSRRVGVPMARAALAWVLARPWTASAVCGASSASQWRELCGAASCS